MDSRSRCGDMIPRTSSGCAPRAKIRNTSPASRCMPTCVVIGSPDAAIAQRLQRAFFASWFRPYTNDDVAGIELGGALKNIFAIAAGVCDGLRLGDNAKAALITRALVELGRLAEAL